MVIGIDLKPLSQETIEKMGYDNQNLWLVKIGAEVFGPYETESLKHYVSDNETLFENAEASRVNETEWKPFWAHTKFQRRKPQVITSEMHEGPFWIMDMGLKVGPLSFREIDKKIEMGLLVMTDHISIDDGQNWLKIYQIEGFDRRSHNPDDLPVAPYDSSFQKSRLLVVEKLEEEREEPVEELADMAWQAQQYGKVIQFKLEEMTLKKEKETPVSESLKWKVPTAAAVLLGLLTAGHHMLSPEETPVVADSTVEDSRPFYQNKAPSVAPAPKAVIPSPRPYVPERSPASVQYQRPRVEVEKPISRYPTHIETHEDAYNDNFIDREPLDAAMDENPVPQEHSLVGNNHPQTEDDSLNAAMGGSDPQDDLMQEPQIIESNDF